MIADNLMVGDNQVSKVYLGEELVWSSAPPMTYSYENAQFSADADIYGTFPTRGYDYRSSGSNNPGWTFQGMLVAGDNSLPTYWTLLTEHQYNGEEAWVQLRVGNVVSPLSRPLGLIFAANQDMTVMYMVDIGSDGCRIRVIDNGSTATTDVFHSNNISSGASVRVVRTNDGRFRIHAGTADVYWTPPEGTYPGAANGFGYIGLSLFSSSGQWCTRVDAFTAAGEGYPN